MRKTLFCTAGRTRCTPAYSKLYSDGSGTIREQGELIADAFLTSIMFAILTRLEKDEDSKGAAALDAYDLEKIHAGGLLVNRLQKAAEYLNRDREQLVPQPDGVKIAIVLSAEKGLASLGDETSDVVEVLTKIGETKLLDTSASSKKQYLRAANFFRSLHHALIELLQEYNAEENINLAREWLVPRSDGEGIVASSMAEEGVEKLNTQIADLTAHHEKLSDDEQIKLTEFLRLYRQKLNTKIKELNPIKDTVQGQ